MLEILGLSLLCKKNMANALLRGRKPGLFIFLTLLLWVGCEVTLIIIGNVLELGFGAYLLGIAGAALGGLVSYLIAKNCKTGDYVPAVSAAHTKANTPAQAYTPAQTKTPISAQGTMWVFACYDNDRVAAMSMFGNMAQHYSKEHVVDAVRNRFSIPNAQSIDYAGPTDWNAPVIKVKETSFDMDLTATYTNIGQFLMAKGHHPADIQQAINTSSTMPNPSLGLLLICVDMRKGVQQPAQAVQTM